jgi:hypothetical protein
MSFVVTTSLFPRIGKMELDTFGQMVDDLLHIATFFLAGWPEVSRD